MKFNIVRSLIFLVTVSYGHVSQVGGTHEATLCKHISHKLPILCQQGYKNTNFCERNFTKILNSNRWRHLYKCWLQLWTRVTW
jgi:hypothetical protein